MIFAESQLQNTSVKCFNIEPIHEFLALTLQNIQNYMYVKCTYMYYILLQKCSEIKIFNHQMNHEIGCDKYDRPNELLSYSIRPHKCKCKQHVILHVIAQECSAYLRNVRLSTAWWSTQRRTVCAALY